MVIFPHIRVDFRRFESTRCAAKTVGVSVDGMDSLESTELNREEPHVVDDLDDDDLSDGE